MSSKESLQGFELKGIAKLVYIRVKIKAFNK